MHSVFWSFFLIVVLPFGLLGVVAGRFPWLLVLVFLPFVVAWVLYQTSYGGPDDDISGPASMAFAIVGTGAFLAGAALTRIVRNAWRMRGDESAN